MVYIEARIGLRHAAQFFTAVNGGLLKQGPLREITEEYKLTMQELAGKFGVDGYDCRHNPTLTFTGVIYNREIPNDWWRIPWSYQKKVNLPRLCQALVAFTDGYAGRIPREFFNSEKSLEFVDEIIKLSAENGRVGLEDQFGIAMKLANNYPIAAGLIAHFAFRASARRYDKRAGLNVPTYRAKQLAEAIKWFDADFSKTHSPDPLGDMYHFWAQFCAGMVLRQNFNVAPAEVVPYSLLFYSSPLLMKCVRNSILKTTLLFGDHKNVDRLGLSTGWCVSKFLLEKIP